MITNLNLFMALLYHQRIEPPCSTPPQPRPRYSESYRGSNLYVARAECAAFRQFSFLWKDHYRQKTGGCGVQRLYRFWRRGHGSPTGSYRHPFFSSIFTWHQLFCMTFTRRKLIGRSCEWSLWDRNTDAIRKALYYLIRVGREARWTLVLSHFLDCAWSSRRERLWRQVHGVAVFSFSCPWNEYESRMIPGACEQRRVLVRTRIKLPVGQVDVATVPLTPPSPLACVATSCESIFFPLEPRLQSNCFVFNLM